MKRDVFIKTIQVLLSSLLYALAIKCFIVPCDLVTGGTTGLSLAVGHIFNADLSSFILALNATLLVIGWLVLGKEFALNTALATLSMPIILMLLEKALPNLVLTTDIFLGTVFAGILVGLSIAICMRAGASTGGIDIITLMLKKFFKIPVGVSLYAIDFLIILLQFSYQSSEKVLYGIILAIIYTIIVDKLLVVGTNRFELKIISDMSDEIRKAIISELDRGLTIIHGQGGYSEENKEIILSVVSNREFNQFEKFVHRIDPEAFIIVSKVTEVSGKGFTLPKTYINRNEDKQFSYKIDL